MINFPARGLGLLLALAVFALAAFALQVNLLASESPPNLTQAMSAH
jgi:hypothetical protein